jgi:hypothetical protein
MEKTTPSPSRLRHSFTPDALARFSRLFDEVWKELLEEGVLDATHDPLARRRLAKTLFRLARSPWSDIQMRQLLIRAFRNEAARLQLAQLQSRSLTELKARAVAPTHESLPSLLVK